MSVDADPEEELTIVGDPSTEKQALDHGLSAQEFAEILRLMNRAPNLTELGVFSAMWNEHCSYKSSKLWLRKLPSDGRHVICGPGENAGVVDIGGGLAAVFKMESHNHPSYIEPYQGAATGVGGILRDVFTMGARPVANVNALRFGAPDHEKTKHLVSGVVAGIGGYGNCVGVPTIAGEVTFHPRYNGNILVNAMTVGIAPADRIFYSAADGIGNPVVYVGSKTGRDGIHGASMASAEFDDATEEKRPTVQVGDPFTEKLLIEACLELMDQDAIIAIQDMGAAGLTSSSVEMAAKGGVGIELVLDRVPQRETGMTAYELMLSESQERMLMILRPGSEAQAKAIFDKWDLDFAVIGETTDTNHLVLIHEDDCVGAIPLSALADAAPVYDRPYEAPPALSPIMAQDVSEAMPADEALRTLMASPSLASRRWVWEQYDNTVMGDTLQIPGGDAGVVRVHGTRKGLAVTSDCTPRYCAAGPLDGGRQAVAEAWRNLIAVGATPLAITNCLNFGNPERPDVMGQFVYCLEGMAEAAHALRFPVVSGNVSLYNETNGRSILPTPTIGGLGLIDDIDLMMTLAFKAEDEDILLLGRTDGHFGQSLYLALLAGREDGAPPPVDLAQEARVGHFVHRLIRDRLVTAVHDVSDGGVAVAIGEMALAGAVGASLTPDLETMDLPLAALLFAEDQARYCVTVPAQLTETVLAEAADEAVPVTRLGKTGRNSIDIAGCASLSLEALRASHEDWLPKLMSGAL